MHLEDFHGVICLDIGGTNIRGCWFSCFSQGKVLLKKRPHNREGTLMAFKDLVREIMDEAPKELEIKAIGIATAGPLDVEKKMYLSTANMPEMDMFPLGRFVEDTFSLPCVMENDAQAAAVGEFFHGGKEEVQDLLLITLGTGVGTGVILKGRLWRAAHITGPELGHVFMGGKTRCGCGQRGCAETMLSSRALKGIVREEMKRELSIRDLIYLCQSGERGVVPVLKRYGNRLGKFLCILQTIFGIKYICISGGMSKLFPFIEEYVWQMLEQELDKRRWWLPQGIYSARDPDMSALYGMFEILKRGEDICW